MNQHCVLVLLVLLVPLVLLVLLVNGSDYTRSSRPVLLRHRK